MEQITKPHCGARLDRLPDCRWHSSMFAIVAFGLLVCWSNAVGGLILAQLKALGWTDNHYSHISAITTAECFSVRWWAALATNPVAMRSSSMRPFILPRWLSVLSHQYRFSYCLPFCDGRWAGSFTGYTVAGFTEYMPSRNPGTWSSGFPLLATGDIRSAH